MDDMDVDWLDSNPIFGLELLEETSFLERKFPFLNVV
jgi:hypothetical protein